MKIYIGPYRYRLVSKIHDNYMKKKYGYNDWPETQTRFENFLEKVEDSIQWAYNHSINLILGKRPGQKIKVRIDNYDTWSMDHTLAYIIIPMLKQLKETQHGSPWTDDEDVPEELRSTSAPPLENDYDTDDNHYKRWEYVLDEMIWAFEQKTYNWEEQYTTGEYDFRFEKVEGSECSQMVKGPNHTAVTDWEGRKAHQKRMSNGFRLFGKYYESLWN